MVHSGNHRASPADRKTRSEVSTPVVGKATVESQRDRNPLPDGSTPRDRRDHRRGARPSYTKCGSEQDSSIEAQ